MNRLSPGYCGKDELKNFLYALLEGIRVVSVYLYPMMPHTSESIQRQLGISEPSFSLEKSVWGLEKSFIIKKETPLFPRIDVD